MSRWFELYGQDGLAREEYLFRRWFKTVLAQSGTRGWSLESQTIGARTAELSLVRRGDGGPRRYSAAYLMFDRQARKEAFRMLSAIARQAGI